MVMRLPLSSEIVLGLGGAIDANLLKGVTGAIAITSVSVVGSTLTIEYKDDSDVAQTASLTSGAGTSITSGTADPTGGSAGDLYVQVNAAAVVQAIWENIADTWTEYTILQLTNTAPRSVSTGANSAGDSPDAAHRNHHHQAPASSSIIHGLVELSTNAEGLETGDSTHAIVPSVLDHVLEASRNTDRIQEIADAGNEGIENALRYTDSNAWVRNAERQESGYHRNLCYFDGALYYSDLAGVIHDVNGNSKTVDADAVHTIRVANHYVVVTPTELRTYALTSGPVIATHTWTSDTDRIAHSLITDPEVGEYVVLMSRHPNQAHHLTWYEVSQTDGTISPVNTIEFTLGEINGYLGSDYEDIPSLFGVDGDGLRGAAVNKNHLRLLVNRAISVDDPTDVVSVIERFLITATSPAIQIQHDPDARETLSEFSDSLSIVLPDRDAGVLYFGSISHRSVYERGNRAQVHYENILDLPVHSAVPDTLLEQVGRTLKVGTGKRSAWEDEYATDFSDDDPANVGGVATPGTEDIAVREGHAHDLLIQDTLYFDSTDQLGVNVHDVISESQEKIQYFTSSNDFDSGGASSGQVYTTSPFDKEIYKVSMEMLAPAGEPKNFIARLAIVDDNNHVVTRLGNSNTVRVANQSVHNFLFNQQGDDGGGGIVVPASVRISIVGSRIGIDSDSPTLMHQGSEAATSPNESYDNASEDFVLVNDVIYHHAYPDVGDQTHSHGQGVRGNIRIFYRKIINHGQLVGDGNVNVDHISSGSATDDQFVGNDGAGVSIWKAPPGGASLSDDAPLDVGTADAGTGDEASRDDHVHAGDAASGTLVVANPAGTDGDDLDRVSIAGTNYVIPEGGGVVNTEAVEYLARTAVDVSSAFAEITLTTALTDGYMLAFDVDSGAGNTVGGRVLVPSTLLRVLPAFPAAPTDSTDVDDAYISAIARVTLTSIITQGLSYLSIWYKDDTHLWVIDSRQEITGVALTGYPMGGGGVAPASSGISLFHRVAVGAEITLAGHLTSASWIFSTFESISFTDVDIGDLLYIDFTLRIAGEVEQVHRISRNTLRAIGFQNTTGYAPYLDADDDVINGAIVPCYTVMGNGGAGNLREDFINPTMGRVNSHNNSGRGQIHFFFVENAGKLASINVSTRQNNVVILTRMDIVLEQEAS